MTKSSLGHMSIRLGGICCVVTLVAARAGATALGSYPAIDISVPSETDDAWSYRTEHRAVARSRLSSKIEPEMTVRLTPELSLFAQGGVRAVRKPEFGAGCAFAGQRSSAGTLYRRSGMDRLAGPDGSSAPGAALSPAFSRGFNGAEGTSGVYGFTERVGFQGGVSLSTRDVGRHDLTASTVFLDSTFFDWPSGQDYRSRAYGYAEQDATTSTSYLLSVALGGANFSELPGLHYRLAVTRKPGEDGDKHVETGFIAGAGYTVGFWDEITVAPRVQLAVYDGAGEVRDRSMMIETMAGHLAWNGWNLSVSWTDNGTMEPDGAESRTTQFQVSTGYRFSFGLSLHLGWTSSETNGAETRTLGGQLDYTIRF